MPQPRRHPYPTVALHNVRPSSKFTSDNERTQATNAMSDSARLLVRPSLVRLSRPSPPPSETSENLSACAGRRISKI